MDLVARIVQLKSMNIMATKKSANIVQAVAMDLDVLIAPQRNIDMEVVRTSAVGVVQLVLDLVAQIVQSKNMKNKKVVITV
jgi:hypothetical protein